MPWQLKSTVDRNKLLYRTSSVCRMHVPSVTSSHRDMVVVRQPMPLLVLSSIKAVLFPEELNMSPRYLTLFSMSTLPTFNFGMSCFFPFTTMTKHFFPLAVSHFLCVNHIILLWDYIMSPGVVLTLATSSTNTIDFIDVPLCMPPSRWVTHSAVEVLHNIEPSNVPCFTMAVTLKVSVDPTGLFTLTVAFAFILLMLIVLHS